MSTKPETVAPRAGKREWIGLAVIALPCLLYSMDLTVLHLAVPKLSEAVMVTGVSLTTSPVVNRPSEEIGKGELLQVALIN